MTNKYLKSIAYKLTGLELKIHNNYNKTAFGVETVNEKVIRCEIVMSKKYIDNLFNNDLDIRDRGFSKKYLYLQVLLHEIAHYKQYKRLGFKYFNIAYKINSDYFEKQADKYALSYYKNFI